MTPENRAKIQRMREETVRMDCGLRSVLRAAEGEFNRLPMQPADGGELRLVSEAAGVLHQFQDALDALPRVEYSITDAPFGDTRKEGQSL